MPLNCTHKTVNFMLYIFPSKKALHLHWNKNNTQSKLEDQFHFVQNSTGIQNKRKSHYISIYVLPSKESDTTERLHFHFSLSCIGEGNGNPLQCSCLENPREGEPHRLPSMGSHRVGHDWSDLAAAKTYTGFFFFCCWL